MNYIFVAVNEFMTVLTLTIAFPGLLPPKDRMECVMFCMLMIPMSLVWWIYLAVAPITFLILWWATDWTPKEWLEQWPWKQLFGHDEDCIV